VAERNVYVHEDLRVSLKSGLRFAEAGSPRRRAPGQPRTAAHPKREDERGRGRHFSSGRAPLAKVLFPDGRQRPVGATRTVRIASRSARGGERPKRPSGLGRSTYPDEHVRLDGALDWSFAEPLLEGALDRRSYAGEAILVPTFDLTSKRRTLAEAACKLLGR